MKLVKQSNGMEMRKETGNHRIKGSQDIPSIIIMSDTNGSKRTDHGGIPRSGKGGLSLDNRASQVVIKRNPCQKIGTWNVRSLFHPGKLENTVAEMKRLELDILGVSDVQWPGSGKCKTNHGEFYYSGNEDPTHRQGVGILVDNKYQKAVCSFVPFSDRVMMLSFNSKSKRKINFIQVYAPTADKDEQEVESFYHQIKSVMKLTKRHDINILMGDFNAKVGAGEVEGCVGHYGLGERNERGDRLVEFCQSEELVIANTLFKQPKRRLYTWRSPADSEDRIVRNQIDFITINKRYRNSVISTKTYPGADIYSDHNPVVSVLRIRLKNVKRNVKAQIMDPKRLKEHNTYCETKEKINEALKHTKREIAELRGVDNKWEHLRDVLMSVGKQTIKPMREKRKPWMTEEILDMMEARRLEKTTNVIRYKEIHRTIVKATRQAKEKWLSDKCKEIEVLDRKYDSFNVHKKIKEMTGGQKPRFPGLLRTSDGCLIADAKEKLLHWTNYIRELFQDERTEPSLDNTEDTGPSILRQEVLYAIRNTKSGKATGPDELPIELLKLIEEELIDVLVDLFNLIYETGTIPTMWLQSTFVAIPKKTGAITCAEHRTIALMSHTLKAFLKIIHGRICRTLECDISDTQFGFRNGMGTREALFGLNVLAQRCMDMNQDLYVCFVDFEKAFDTVQHEKLLEILKDKNIDSRNITIISQLYWNQTARMKVDEHLTPDIAIQKGVRQGCVLSPLLFNVYSEAVFQQTFSDCSEGITINGEVLNNLRFADDTAIIANNIDDLQSMIQRLNMCCKEYGLKMNLKKTKYMIISKTTITNIRLSIEHTEIERVEKYKYLGTWITSNVDQSKEIKARVEVARSTFIKLKKILHMQGHEPGITHENATLLRVLCSSIWPGSVDTERSSHE